MNEDNSIILQIVPATGWRAVFLNGDALGASVAEREEMPDEKLVSIKPIAVFALVERESRERDVRAILPDDWPEYLWMLEGDYFVCYLGPGQELDDEDRAGIREEAARLKKKADDEEEDRRAETRPVP